LLYRKAIDAYIYKNKDMRAFDLSEDEWDALERVAFWLRCFREATTMMSTTKDSQLGNTHTVYRGLQDHLKEALVSLPANAPISLRTGLVEAHRKLSDYLHIIDDSPYYL
ncbi:hypothetical protein SISNIDRAFT_395671, partial [Sistotremastrum niveocremeum HHB9708]